MLFWNPYEPTESIVFNRFADTEMFRFRKDMDLSTVWERVPDKWLNRIKQFHTNLCEAEKKISTRALAGKLENVGYWRDVFQSLPNKAIKQVERILRESAQCTSQAMEKVFAGHDWDYFHLSPESPGWSLHLLHACGAVYPNRIDESTTNEIIPEPLRPLLQTIVENPPPSRHEFPVPPDERLRLSLPSRSYFDSITEQIPRVIKTIKEKKSREELVREAGPLLGDPFKICMLFMGILEESSIGHKSLEKPVNILRDELKNSCPGQRFASILEDLIFLGYFKPEFVLGKDSRGQVHCHLWKKFQSYFSDVPGVNSNLFCHGKFETVPIYAELHSFGNRVSMLIPLILQFKQDPFEQAIEWIQAYEKANHKVNQCLPSGVLRWIETESDSLSQEQRLEILQKGTRHRRSGLRQMAYRVMRDIYPEKFWEERDRALQDDTAKVREWASKQNQRQLF